MLVGPDRGGRFAAGVAGAVVASLVWLVATVATTTTPGEARDQRASPELPPPTVVLKKTVLRQVAWYRCTQDRTTVQVEAPTPPQGFRSVVTSLAHSDRDVTTGTKVASVAGQPLIAVVTSAAFYRDLVVGDRGPDVRGFEQALQRAGAIPRADDVLDTAAVAVWQSRFDSSSPAGRVRLSTLVPVPPEASVGSVMVTVGQKLKPGSVLMEVNAGSNEFSCDVPDPAGEITPEKVTFEVDGRPVAVEAVVAHKRGSEGPGHVDVRPVGKVSKDQARLGIESSRSDGPVLVAPLSAIKTGADGKQTVVVVTGTARREVRVSLGLTAQGLVEIEGKGLDEGVRVALFDAAKASKTGSQKNGRTQSPSIAPSGSSKNP